MASLSLVPVSLDVRTFFDSAQARQFNGIPHRYHQTVDGDHGRVEVRRYWTVDQFEWLADRAKWKGLNLIGSNRLAPSPLLAGLTRVSITAFPSFSRRGGA